MTHSPQLSDLQLDVLRVLWDRGEAGVADVHQALYDQRKLAVTTVATLLNRLEKRGLVRHRREGRQFVYAATVPEGELRKTMVEELTDRVFQGSAADLVHHLLNEDELSPGDLERVRAMIDAKVREKDSAE